MMFRAWLASAEADAEDFYTVEEAQGWIICQAAELIHDGWSVHEAGGPLHLAHLPSDETERRDQRRQILRRIVLRRAGKPQEVLMIAATRRVERSDTPA